MRQTHTGAHTTTYSSIHIHTPDNSVETNLSKEQPQNDGLGDISGRNSVHCTNTGHLIFCIFCFLSCLDFWCGF